ncbi:MAG: 16S rRNA (guanine(966)-N(2))-methyltransferase RsmD [Negativicutes bacterium]|nr:16S rRNA (guanine(966)-N(2))-methyltransferase RsmD [Negativicutes bacterium]
MRIIAGFAKGMKLQAPPGLRVRPTGDRMKESLFSMLMPRMIGARVLDLFCGTGNLGLEAKSRGAVNVVFVDASPESLAYTQKNWHQCRFEGEPELLRLDLPQSLHQLTGSYSLIFVDPPYGEGLATETLQDLSKRSILEDGGWAIFEHGPEEKMPPKAGNWQVVREKRFGKAYLTIYEKK